ncbi:MAG: hypothetical protein VX269_02000, partial [Verrucomicrobiota bacterium]|nr:hypothetical protein [Verrucomicrobiota bacterium]
MSHYSWNRPRVGVGFFCGADLYSWGNTDMTINWVIPHWSILAKCPEFILPPTSLSAPLPDASEQIPTAFHRCDSYRDWSSNLANQRACDG